MDDLGCYDWTKGSLSDHKAITRKASAEELRRVARIYDWQHYPEEVLGWIMAQKSIDLGAALTAFFNGDPERFNYLSKRDVPDEFRSAARVLDNICLRVNSGFYLFRSGEAVDDEKRLERWLTYQEADRTEGRRGRWILDERILKMRSPAPSGSEALPKIAADADPGPLARPARAKRRDRSKLFGGVLSPFAQVGVPARR